MSRTSQEVKTDEDRCSNGKGTSFGKVHGYEEQGQDQGEHFEEAGC